MLEVQKLVFNRAVANLAALGCKFAIRLPDGTTVGELKVMPEKVPNTRRPRQDYSQFDIINRIEAMKPGDVLEIECEGTGFDPQRVCSNISSHGIHRYGNGNFTTCKVGTRAQGMRVA